MACHLSDAWQTIETTELEPTPAAAPAAAPAEPMVSAQIGVHDELLLPKTPSPAVKTEQILASILAAIEENREEQKRRFNILVILCSIFFAFMLFYFDRLNHMVRHARREGW